MRATPIAATFSKNSDFWFGNDPVVSAIEDGEGAYVFDPKGSRYLDWVSGLGATLFGHNPRGFASRISRAVGCGLGFSLPNCLEEEIADRLRRLVAPGAGWDPEETQVRFGATGTDACMAAVRLARWRTGHTGTLSWGYHGWSDPLVAHSPPAWGVLNVEKEHIQDFEWNNPESVLKAHHRLGCREIAAVFIEHPLEAPTVEWTHFLRDFCDRHGALLIVDEVVTGVRYGWGGACKVHGYRPDIIVMGKALGNGMPISALLAPHDIMQTFESNDPVFVLSSTTNANSASLAAAEYVMDHWNQAAVDHIWGIGRALIDGLAVAGWNVVGEPPRSLIQFRDPCEKAYFIRRMAEQGVLMNRPNFPTLAHTMEDVTKTILAARAVRGELDQMSNEQLKGFVGERIPRTLFANR